MIRTIALATLVAGTLDILSAFAFSGAVIAVLQTVASGPLGDDMAASPVGPPVGLLVHFAIMAAMVTVYVLAARRIPALKRHWIVSGLLYGLLLWIVMYWIVMPLRWESYRTPSELVPIAKQLFSHCILTGLPIGFITAHAARPIRPSCI
jgi:predicted membrane protein